MIAGADFRPLIFITEDTSKNRSEQFDCKAHGAEKPQCTRKYMRISSTAQRGNRTAQ